MTNAITGNFTCKICNEIIECSYPNYKTWIGGELWSIPKSRKYYKAVARMNHNAMHKGDIDKWLRS